MKITITLAPEEIRALIHSGLRGAAVIPPDFVPMDQEYSLSTYGRTEIEFASPAEVESHRQSVEEGLRRYRESKTAVSEPATSTEA